MSTRTATYGLLSKFERFVHGIERGFQLSQRTPHRLLQRRFGRGGTQLTSTQHAKIRSAQAAQRLEVYNKKTYSCASVQNRIASALNRAAAPFEVAEEASVAALEAEAGAAAGEGEGAVGAAGGGEASAKSDE
jgi:hypothetical protein